MIRKRGRKGPKVSTVVVKAGVWGVVRNGTAQNEEKVAALWILFPAWFCGARLLFFTRAVIVLLDEMSASASQRMCEGVC